MDSIERVSREFGVRPLAGMGADAVARSRAARGANAMTRMPRKSLWRQFVEKFDDPVVKILMAAALLSLAIAVFRHFVPAPGARAGAGLLTELIEGVAILVAVALATGVAFLNEYKSDREFELLNQRKQSVRARVRRDHQVVELPLEEVVVGDVVLVEAGDEVPADGRLLETEGLTVDQSVMTGESRPVRKHVCAPDDETADLSSPGCVYRGTTVVDGAGVMLVTAVGDASELGRIARSLSATDLDAGGDDDDDDEERAGAAGARGGPSDAKHRVVDKLTVRRAKTPLQERLGQLADVISWVGKIAAALIFLALAVRGLVGGELRGFDVATANQLLDYGIVVIVIVVVAVPEGLPMSVTVALAMAMRKMAKQQCLVRQLMACETIGSATVICSDKTGTLTRNAMAVQEIALADGAWRPQGEVALAATPAEGERARAAGDRIALNAAINATAHLEARDGRVVPLGNVTEGALLAWLRARGWDYAALREGEHLREQLHFSSERKRMSSVVDAPGGPTLFTKGAPEVVLARCARVLADGAERPLDEAARARLSAAVEAASAKMMRVLAFAHRPLDPAWVAAGAADTADEDQRFAEVERDLVFDGLVAITDPVRDDVPAALARCRSAGIEVKMVTGDNVATARAIAASVGLLDAPDARVLTSDEFGAMSDEALAEVLSRVKVLARARPHDKQRIVRLLQGQGEVVAVTGDGTNDALALKQADVGLAMGSGTEVAKEASKMVLLDDSFATIVSAVAWGRSLYENIQRFLQFQLTINAAALVIAFVGPLLSRYTGVDRPLTAVQLLWVNVIMDTFAAIAFCGEPPHPSVMDRPPRRRGEHIITRPMLWTMGVTATFYVAGMLGLMLAWGEAGVQPRPTIFFTAFVLLQVWNMFNCRSLDPREGAFAGVLQNTSFLAIAGAIVVVQVLLVTFGGAAFHTVALDARTWLLVAAGTASVLVVGALARGGRAALAGGA